LDELKLYLGSFIVAGGSYEQKKLRNNKVIHAVKADALLNYVKTCILASQRTQFPSDRETN
jgi:hypothetical protein